MKNSTIQVDPIQIYLKSAYPFNQSTIEIGWRTWNWSPIQHTWLEVENTSPLCICWCFSPVMLSIHVKDRVIWIGIGSRRILVLLSGIFWLPSLCILSIWSCRSIYIYGKLGSKCLALYYFLEFQILLLFHATHYAVWNDRNFRLLQDVSIVFLYSKALVSSYHQALLHIHNLLPQSNEASMEKPAEYPSLDRHCWFSCTKLQASFWVLTNVHPIFCKDPMDQERRQPQVSSMWKVRKCFGVATLLLHTCGTGECMFGFSFVLLNGNGSFCVSNSKNLCPRCILVWSNSLARKIV